MSKLQKSVELPEEQHACIKCANLNEQSVCSEGRTMEISDITVSNNGCPKFKPFLVSDF